MTQEELENNIDRTRDYAINRWLDNAKRCVKYCMNQKNSNIAELASGCHEDWDMLQKTTEQLWQNERYKE